MNFSVPNRRSRKAGRQLLSAVTAALMIAAGSGNSLAAEPPVPTLEVAGSGSAAAAPDMAIIGFGVVSEAETARAALDQNNAAMRKVLDELAQAGIAEKDVQTANFNIQPRYHYPKRKNNGEQPPPVITGYQVSNQVTVRVRELEQTGAILDTVVTLGVNSGGNIRFSNADPAEFLEKARKAAVEDAIQKARTLASAAGVGLKRILSIRENFRQPRPVALGRAQMSVAEDAAVPIATGENTYEVNVTVSWELEQ